MRRHFRERQNAGGERERRRAKGQFWTPDWVAHFMVAYALQDRPNRLLDPAVGEGAFFRAAKSYAARHGFNPTLIGYDVDPEVVTQARRSGLSENDLQHVEIRDFVLDPPADTYPAIVANPPYIRHHRLDPSRKTRLREFAKLVTGENLDGRAGLHVYFLLQALQRLSPGGRLAYLVSADVCEGVFAESLWRWICSRYRLDAVITFAPEVAPFPDVDANALVFCLRRERPAETFVWARCRQKDAEAVADFFSGRRTETPAALERRTRMVDEALATGLSRPTARLVAGENTLGDFAVVKRGVATGDNDFFFLTKKQLAELGIPEPFFVPAIGRVRDVAGAEITCADLERLERGGRPTRLLSLDDTPFEALPAPVQAYLREGERRGIPRKALVQTRKPWWRMEKRASPPILFAYLGRRRARFIRNHAGVVPLTCLLCVYPRHPDTAFVERLWRVLSHPQTIENLGRVGKSYGGGAIKVEPRALEKLPLPPDVIRAQGLDAWRPLRQESLFGASSGRRNRFAEFAEMNASRS